MHLTDILYQLTTKKIDMSIAAGKFGLTEKSLKSRLTKAGSRMPLVLLTLDQIVAGVISRADAARTLDVTPRQINKLMKSWSVDRPVQNYLVGRVVSKLKWDVRTKFSIDYIAGSANLEAAASGAGVSTRQIRRWVSSLLDKYYGMVFKDLRKTPEMTRRRLAEAIAADESLDTATQEMLVEISEDRLLLQREALTRVRAKGKKRRFQE